MASYKLVVRKSIANDLRSIPKRDVQRILKRIAALAEDPRPQGCEKLSGQERYRVCQGIYRIVYEIRDETLIVTVVKVAHRRHIYRNT
ncbi:MAG: type II toxin-antitoxin system RelE/ParE family toxin [Gammaproteobacteria bacterium]|nr:type II toxin-antitoxin system RelE/ParE family toxin [Gammaproteobacteria bacterium]